MRVQLLDILSNVGYEVSTASGEEVTSLAVFEPDVVLGVTGM